MKGSFSAIHTIVAVICGTPLGMAFAASPSIDEEIQNNLQKRLLYNAECIKELSTVTITDGISEAEAGIIAKNLKVRYISCGGLDSISDEHDRWVIHFGIGNIGTRKVDAIVMKKDGATTTTFVPGKTLSPYQLWD